VSAREERDARLADVARFFARPPLDAHFVRSWRRARAVAAALSEGEVGAALAVAVEGLEGLRRARDEAVREGRVERARAATSAHDALMCLVDEATDLHLNSRVADPGRETCFCCLGDERLGDGSPCPICGDGSLPDDDAERAPPTGFDKGPELELRPGDKVWRRTVAGITDDPSVRTVSEVAEREVRFVVGPPERRPLRAIDWGVELAPAATSAAPDVAPVPIEGVDPMRGEKLSASDLLSRLLATEAERDELRRELRDYEASFDLRRAADKRAIARWREGYPEREPLWPDHADLVAWLLERLDAKPAAEAPQRQRDPGEQEDERPASPGFVGGVDGTETLEIGDVLRRRASAETRLEDLEPLIVTAILGRRGEGFASRRARFHDGSEEDLPLRAGAWELIARGVTANVPDLLRTLVSVSEVGRALMERNAAIEARSEKGAASDVWAAIDELQCVLHAAGGGFPADVVRSAARMIEALRNDCASLRHDLELALALEREACIATQEAIAATVDDPARVVGRMDALRTECARLRADLGSALMTLRSSSCSALVGRAAWAAAEGGRWRRVEAGAAAGYSLAFDEAGFAKAFAELLNVGADLGHGLLEHLLDPPFEHPNPGTHGRWWRAVSLGDGRYRLVSDASAHPPDRVTVTMTIARKRWLFDVPAWATPGQFNRAMERAGVRDLVYMAPAPGYVDRVLGDLGEDDATDVKDLVVVPGDRVRHVGGAWDRAKWAARDGGIWRVTAVTAVRVEIRNGETNAIVARPLRASEWELARESVDGHCLECGSARGVPHDAGCRHGSGAS
jgi:hypothetical protein